MQVTGKNLILIIILRTGEKRFQCTVCGLKMHTSGELKQHTWIHTGKLLKNALYFYGIILRNVMLLE